MTASDITAIVAQLPKAELHLHMEGSVAPETAVQLARRHGVEITPGEVARRYRSPDFSGFLDAYKWVTSFLREPQDYALIADELFSRLAAQNVVYAEITISASVMLRRNQDVAANFAALAAASSRANASGLRIQWIFDTARQFGPEAALETARWAARLASQGVVAFGVGGDELALSAADLRPAYDLVRDAGLRAVAHAGEIGPPQAIREAIEILGAERIGHGIAAALDPALMDRLASDGVTLEVCPTSNLRTGALARQFGAESAHLDRHPLKSFFDRGLRVALSTDDPAMFETDLIAEYAVASRLGLAAPEIARLAEMSFHAALLPEADRQSYLARFRKRAREFGLL
jgi:adenosine deaminase